MHDWIEKSKAAAHAIQARDGRKPQIGLILGSGLGGFADDVSEAVTVPFADIPHFPTSSVSGHAGQLVSGILGGKNVAIMQGRVHYYEGYSMKQVAFPVWVLRQLGIELLLITNACGGLNPSFLPGDLMLITDHLNWMRDNPLLGANLDEMGPRFPDMTQAYRPELLELALSVAQAENIPLRQGVYTATTGPIYETRATLRMLRQLGSDAVGMSTVPEIVAAVHAGISTIAISTITDIVKDDPAEILTHEEVLAVANQTVPRLARLLRGIIRAYTPAYLRPAPSAASSPP